MTDHFESRAKDWDANERRTRLAAAVGAEVTSRVELRDDMAVLDFGAGTGLLTERIAPRVGRLVAVDISPAMLDQLAAKTALDGRVETVCRDILAEPLEERFDLVVSAMTLHHVEDTAGLLRALRAHLRAGGMVALADLDREDGCFHPADAEGVFHHGFDRAALGSLLQAAGFEAVEFGTAHRMIKDGREYPVFLVTARKG